MATKKKEPAAKKPAGKKPAAKSKAAGGNGDGAAAAAAAAQAAPEAAAGERQLSILVQFVKDLSFESPNAPTSLQGPGENPQLQINVNVNVNGHGNDIFEVDLQLEANAKSDTGVIYNIELVYGGMFRILGFAEEDLHRLLFIDCPTILFPFARRIVSDMTRDGAFPPLNLDPIDFNGLYQHNLAQAQAEAEETA